MPPWLPASCGWKCLARRSTIRVGRFGSASARPGSTASLVGLRSRSPSAKPTGGLRLRLASRSPRPCAV
eukprot:11128998-Alexandrium_andersonii.AAC.1